VSDSNWKALLFIISTHHVSFDVPLDPFQQVFFHSPTCRHHQL
jgi:hypothetical protein